jgi:hypothetical protein
MMSRMMRNFGGLLALLVVGMLPAPAMAAWLGFRNDTDRAVVVQGFSIVGGVVRQGARHTIQPEQLSWDQIVVPGNKLIVIVDAKQPTRTLFRGTVIFGAADQFFSIQDVKGTEQNPANPKPKPQKLPPRVQLVPTDPPSPPPAAGPMGRNMPRPLPPTRPHR